MPSYLRASRALGRIPAAPTGGGAAARAGRRRRDARMSASRMGSGSMGESSCVGVRDRWHRRGRRAHGVRHRGDRLSVPRTLDGAVEPQAGADRRSPDMTPAAIAGEAKAAGLSRVTLPTCSVAGSAIDTATGPAASPSTCGSTPSRRPAARRTRRWRASPRADGKGTNDAAAAEKGPTGKPLDNPARSHLDQRDGAHHGAELRATWPSRLALFGIVVGIALLLSGSASAILAIGGALRNATRWSRRIPTPRARRRPPRSSGYIKERAGRPPGRPVCRCGGLARPVTITAASCGCRTAALVRIGASGHVRARARASAGLPQRRSVERRILRLRLPVMLRASNERLWRAT